MPSLNRYISDEDFAHLLEDAKKIQETNPEIKRMIYEHMDYTRRKYNFTQKEFSQILGCSNTTYSHIMQDNRRMNADNLLTFCRVFNLDITTVVEESYLRKDDAVLRELAVYLAELSDDTLDSIQTAIEASNETSPQIRRGVRLFERLRESETQKAKPPIRLFRRDFTTEEE